MVCALKNNCEYQILSTLERNVDIRESNANNVDGDNNDNGTDKSH